MARAVALVLIGVLLFVAVVYVVSKVTDWASGRRDTLWKIVILVVIAGVAFWYFGNGMVFEYFNK